MEIYSQNSEQTVILDYFGTSSGRPDFNGRFLDIGAYNGKTFSNTYALAKLGWKGVCIEPSPSCFKELIQLYHLTPEIECVNAALAVNNGIVKFWDSNGDAVSTTNEAHKEKWSIVGFKQFYVNTITIKDVINYFGVTYDMVSLDVESTNIEILNTLPLDAMGVKLICVEYDGRPGDVINYCKGFKEIHRNGENIIMAR
jgi:FkbM family methyltransferase